MIRKKEVLPKQTSQCCCNSEISCYMVTVVFYMSGTVHSKKVSSVCCL